MPKNRRARQGTPKGWRREAVRKETKNLTLKKSVEEYGPHEISFEWKDKKTYLHVGKNHVWWSNYVGELVREFSMYYPSWSDIEKSKKAHIKGRPMHHLDLRSNMSSSRWTDIEKGIEQHFAKRYSDNKHNLKRNYWNSDWDKHIEFWLDTKRAARAAKNAKNMAQNIIFCRHDQAEGSRSRYPYGCALHRGAVPCHDQKGQAAGAHSRGGEIGSSSEIGGGSGSGGGADDHEGGDEDVSGDDDECH
uniref:Uncharacterized protein n=1 Tax=Tanacetum cinerariifolium TaxID=118510 RepID=A0A6L2MMC7_TANCI|nr:hypothetical protein [Tanacetum cinerariifolium]